MLIHPFLRAELSATAMRARTYGFRSLYGVVLLFLFWLRYHGVESGSGSMRLSLHEQAEYARTTFEGFVLLQTLIVVALVPLVFAGSVADESQRGTLALLLASRLRSVEIILGKLAAKMLHILVSLALGVPVVSLMSLFGGVDPWLVVLAALGMVSTASFLAALSMLISVHARTPREAKVISLMIVPVWFVVPYLIHFFPPWTWNLWLLALNDWIWPTSPFQFLDPRSVVTLKRAGAFALVRPVVLMVKLQVVYGIVALAMASYRLRPAFRARQDAPRRRSRLLRVLFRPRALPPCGDDPMLWKEWSASGRDGARKLIIALSLAVFALYSLFLSDSFSNKYRDALDELLEYGYAMGPLAQNGRCRVLFNHTLATIASFLSIPFLMVVAVASASGIAGERERGTWTSLVASPLGSWEILRAKMLGAVHAGWPLALLAMLPWLLGLAIGATHPLGFVAALVGLAGFAWFVAALGTFYSLGSKTTSRALAWTMGDLLAINLGPMMVLGALFGEHGLWNGAAVLGCMPVILLLLPFSRRDLDTLILSIDYQARLVFGGLPGPFHFLYAFLVLANVLIYTLAAWLLIWRAVEVFDVTVGRPRRRRPSGQQGTRSLR